MKTLNIWNFFFLSIFRLMICEFKLHILGLVFYQNMGICSLAHVMRPVIAPTVINPPKMILGFLLRKSLIFRN